MQLFIDVESVTVLCCRRSTNLFRILQRFSSNPTELEELTYMSLSQSSSQAQKRSTHWRRPSLENNEFQEQTAAPAYAALSVAGNRLIEAATGEASRRRPLSSKARTSMLLALSKHLNSGKFSRSGKPLSTYLTFAGCRKRLLHASTGVVF